MGPTLPRYPFPPLNTHLAALLLNTCPGHRWTDRPPRAPSGQGRTLSETEPAGGCPESLAVSSDGEGRDPYWSPAW